MRIVDVNGFYAPRGGGVRAYVDWKLAAAARAGHEVLVIAPGKKNAVEPRDGGAIHWIASPSFPLDRRYRMLIDANAVHRLLDALKPDVVEASSPWRTASIVASWRGDADRHWVMHADPLAAYAYRWFGRIAHREAIDRWFSWWWRYLRQTAPAFDSILCANVALAARFRAGGITNARVCRFGVQPGIFSPDLRDLGLRAELCRSCEIGDDALLLLGVGRHSSEKKWSLVIDAVVAAAAKRPMGLILVGEGRESPTLNRVISGNPHIRLLAPIEDRDALARLMASVDGLVHGCDAETFCFVAAEAAASGIPIVAPRLGGAAHAAAGGVVHRFGGDDPASVMRAIGALAADRHGARIRATRAAREGVRTMDDHFTQLFAAYSRGNRLRAAA